jgi:Uma2 family endonuclease
MSTASARRISQLQLAEDPTIYPVEDHMGEGSLQRFVTELLRALIERYLAERGEPTFVGANQFIYYKQFEPSRVVAPDVYIIPGAEPGIRVDSWKTWERQVIPSFALEVVSQDHLKDYRDAPARYDELGVPELVIFDPSFGEAPSERLRFQLFRRLKDRGLVRVETTNDDRVRSRALGCHLRAVTDERGHVRLRLATGEGGEVLFPTAEEAERVARLAAEAEVERLRTELERLRGKGR